MFSTNQKISARQLKRLFVLDFFGKGAVFLPLFAENMESRAFLLGLLLVNLAVILYGKGVVHLSRKIKEDFFLYLKRRLGKGTALALGFCFLGYAFFNFSAIVWVFGQLGREFVLLEMDEGPLIFLILLSSAYVALGEIEVRGRVAETLYPVLFYPIILLLVFSAFHFQPEAVSQEPALGSGLSLRSLFQMFSVFGGLSGFLVIGSKVEGKEKKETAFLKGITVTLFALWVLFFLTAGVFGERGMKGYVWPAVTLMSSVKIPGGFLERWDVIFTVLLMTGLMVSAGAGLFYLLHIAEWFWPKGKKRSLAVFFCAAGGLLALTGEMDGMMKYYGMLNGFIFVPIMAGAVFFLTRLESVKGRKGT